MFVAFVVGPLPDYLSVDSYLSHVIELYLSPFTFIECLLDCRT